MDMWGRRPAEDVSSSLCTTKTRNQKRLGSEAGEEPQRQAATFSPSLVINFPTQSLSEWDEGQNHHFITQHQALKWVTVAEGNWADREILLLFSLSLFKEPLTKKEPPKHTHTKR